MIRIMKIRERVFIVVMKFAATLKGRIEFVNTFTDLNGAWDGRRSAFLCKMPGLYFFSFNARGITTGSNEDLWM